MRFGGWRIIAGRTSRIVVITLGAIALGGCFDEPKIEQRWTRIDLTGSNLALGQSFTLGVRESISVRTSIVYRSIVTGYAVAELRASGSVSPASVDLRPDAPRLNMAQDVDRVLQNSITLGRGIRAVTGWDHLMQDITFSFSGVVPVGMDSIATGSAGGLFMVCYLGSGQRIERPGQPDTVIVTPFVSTARELLPVGLELTVPAPRNN